MASQEELNNAKNLREELGEILFEQRNLASEARAYAKAVFDSSIHATAVAKAFRDVANSTRDFSRELEFIITGEKELADIQKTTENLRVKEVSLMVELNQALSQAGYTEEEIQKVREGSLGVLDLVEQSSKNITNSQFDLLSLYDSQLNNLQDQKEEYAEIEKFAAEVSKGTGITGTLLGGTEEVLNNLGGGKFSKALGLGDALKEGRIESANIVRQTGKINLGDKFKIAGKMLGTVGKNLLKALGPVYLITELVKGIMQADKETVELQKSMSLTRVEAMGFRTELASAAANSGDINITSTKLLETFSDLNKQFGFITNFATDTLVTMTKLTKVVGIGAESAGNLAAASSLTGGSFEDNYKDVLATSYELQRQSGVQMDLRDILEQSGKVTGTVRANLGANPALIAKAITQAKLFGASLEDVASAGKALLDFESSIENELQAELLLGRNINLERARAAALAGDQVTLAQELQQQAGGFEEFTAMNVIQQEALASAMGMQSDQLADILFQQEIQGKTARELRAAGKEELAQRLEAQTLADKFNATVDKLKGIFADVGTAFMPVLQVLGGALSIVGAIVGLLGDLIKMLGGDFSFSGVKAGIKGVGGALGISTADDAIIPSGYGETIVKKGKDTIALNNDDTVVAGTNLGGGTDMSETNQLLKTLVSQNNKKPEISPIGLYQVQ